MTIKAKLIACISSFPLLMAGLIIATFTITGAISTSLKTVVEDRLVPAKELKLVADLYAVNMVDTAHKVRNGGMDWEAGEKSIRDASATIDKTWLAYRATYLTPEEIALAQSFEAKASKAAPSIENLIKIMASKNRAALDTYVIDELYPVIDPLGTDISALIELQIRVGSEEYAKSVASQSLYHKMLWIVALLAATGTGVALWTVMFGVSKPIRLITNSMRGLAEGDTESAIPYAGRSDEIGSMSGAVEVFRQSAIENKRLEAEAEAARGQVEIDRITTQERAEAEASEKLRIATSGLAAGLKRMSSGDLAFELNEAFAPEFEALRQDFNVSIRQLGDALSQISLGITTMDDGTREISTGALDLSRRTEQQAAALEETAAALEEITANVGSSEKRTEDARGVATHANESAMKSTEIVAQAEAAMQRIETSSQQISNIIGVIDEIAFQTNLLALNAGVEAARAGEAGKGFAVVAQEVRELAQRSANAAKEIKGLIQNSTAEVNGGVRLVRDTGIALKTICVFISEINGHMQAIATSTKEQSVGLSEVNQAVNSMDQTTQQNAAMVEQSTAASATLAAEAERLRGLVNQFKLGGGQHSAIALRQVAGAMTDPVRQAMRPSAQVRRPDPAPAYASAGNTALAQDWQKF
ncbi:MAG: methyl-accepting chemotaxis signaling domain protein [Rhizobium sp.]|nr:methyl-accepting chemotaxis signaling domain protein [Rhizobium sp.]